jgi:CheY-like chemotaxis protein
MPYVLIVDDEPDSSEFVSTFLSQHGYKTRCALNGRDALAQLVNQCPDAIVLDVRMPEMDGISLLEVLRSYLRWSTVPVILLTAHATPQQLERAEALGVAKTFQKAQFKLVDLQECLADLFPEQARQQEKQPKRMDA